MTCSKTVRERYRTNGVFPPWCAKGVPKGSRCVCTLYYLSRRGVSSVWYVALRDPRTGKVGTKRSTGTSDRRIAESLAQTWLRDGLPEKPRDSSITFVNYLDSFWDYDRSPYVAETLAAGKRIHRRHANDMRNQVRRYIKPYFGERLLRDVDEVALRQFVLYLKTERHYASSTVNLVRNAATVALRFAKRDRIIRSFDFDLVLRCGGPAADRGILEADEVRKLFETEWRDPRSRLANLIAAETGMRMGEIRALRICDIGIDRIFVRHVWSLDDGGLKETKSGERREIPLLPSIKRAIGDYLDAVLIQYRRESFLMPGLRADRPFDQRQIVKDLFTALKAIGIDEKTRKERNIVFHSWRHYAAKHLSALAPKAIGMKILGHKTSAVFDKYADHTSKEDLAKMREALSGLSSVGAPRPSVHSGAAELDRRKKEVSA